MVYNEKPSSLIMSLLEFNLFLKHHFTIHIFQKAQVTLKLKKILPFYPGYNNLSNFVIIFVPSVDSGQMVEIPYQPINGVLRYHSQQNQHIM